jgi:hypothetical protein
MIAATAIDSCAFGVIVSTLFLHAAVRSWWVRSGVDRVAPPG